jgi:hypothetical protein
MNKYDFEKILRFLKNLKEIEYRRCANVPENDGDRGACYAYNVDPVDEMIKKIEFEIFGESDY